MADTKQERKGLLADFVRWLQQNQLNFFFGSDDPGLHERIWPEAGMLCRCQPPWLLHMGRAVWLSELTALHMVPDLSANDVAAARTRNRRAAFGGDKGRLAIGNHRASLRAIVPRRPKGKAVRFALIVLTTYALMKVLRKPQSVRV